MWKVLQFDDFFFKIIFAKIIFFEEKKIFRENAS